MTETSPDGIDLNDIEVELDNIHNKQDDIRNIELVKDDGGRAALPAQLLDAQAADLRAQAARLEYQGVRQALPGARGDGGGGAWEWA